MKIIIFILYVVIQGIRIKINREDYIDDLRDMPIKSLFVNDNKRDKNEEYIDDLKELKMFSKNKNYKENYKNEEYIDDLKDQFDFIKKNNKKKDKEVCVDDLKDKDGEYSINKKDKEVYIDTLQDDNAIIKGKKKKDNEVYIDNLEDDNSILKKNNKKEKEEKNIKDEKIKLIKKEKEKIKEKISKDNKMKKPITEQNTIKAENISNKKEKIKNKLLTIKQEPIHETQTKRDIIQPLPEKTKLNNNNNPISVTIPSNSNDTVSKLTIPSKGENNANTNINIIIKPTDTKPNQESIEDLDTNLLSQINDKLTALLLSSNNEPKGDDLQDKLLDILSSLSPTKLSNVTSIPYNPTNSSISYYPSITPPTISVPQPPPSTPPSNTKYSKYNKMFLKLQKQINTIQNTISQSNKPQQQQSITTNPPKEIIIQPLIERQPVNQIIQPIQPIIPIQPMISLRPTPPEYTYYKIYNRN